MSLLNQANDGYYSVLIAVCRALHLEGAVERDELIEMCSNKTDPSRGRLNQTILRWTQLGLFIDEKKTISFSETIKARFKRQNLEKFSHELPSILREVIFKKDNNESFWDAEKSRAADLTRGLSWILSQDIYSIPLNSTKLVQSIEIKQIKDAGKTIIQNDTRFNGLRTWGGFLGFIWQSKGLMVDPTNAISEELAYICKPNKEYPADAILEMLQLRIPVIDGGQYRKTLEEVLDPQEWDKPQSENLLSTSLSRALWRLELCGEIELKSRADPKSVKMIVGKDNRNLKSFSHVVYRGAGQ